MLCATCRRSLLARLPTFKNHLPSVSRAISTASDPPTTSTDQNNPPPSSSENTLPPPTSLSSQSNPSKPTRKIRSSVAGGAVLRGLGYTKAKPQILAKEDEEYPDWLWSLLDEKGKSAATASGGVDVTALTKKQRMKHDRKQAKLLKNILPAVPLHEQSKDLTGPGDDAVVSLERRQEIVKSGRVARRKGIREDNFLKGL